MPNKNILTYASRVNAVEQNYYAPAVTVPATGLSFSYYCFLAKVDPWADENNPDQPTQDQASLKRVFKNIFAVKKININDMSPVVERINWTTGTVYSYYQDNVDMLALDPNGFLVYKFYVKNKYDQVFKCLWNNNGAASTIEPYFEPGTYGTNNVFQGADGYKWKYIYTIDTGLKVKFMDTTWMPILAGPTVSSAGGLPAYPNGGNIDVINVTDGGDNYDSVLYPITVSITGDGTGAAGYAVVSSNAISDVIVTNSGQNYTYANVSFSSAQGSGATAVSPTSPVGGHGSNPIEELGCSHVMYTSQFIGTEGGAVSANVYYHQVGLILNPTTADSFPNPANGQIYKTCTTFNLAAGFGQYSQDELVYQGTSLAAATFVGTVLDYDTASSTLSIINITGTPITNAPVFGNTTKTARTLLSYSGTQSGYNTYSGQILYVENRTGIQRSPDGIEQFRFVLGY